MQFDKSLENGIDLGISIHVMTLRMLYCISMIFLNPIFYRVCNKSPKYISLQQFYI